MAAVENPIPVTLAAPPNKFAARAAGDQRWNFQRTLRNNGFLPLRRTTIRDLQINLGKLCNQACNHCHVDAGPKRTEIMTWETMRRILDWIERYRIAVVDITGGAPEMNPNFRRFVQGCIERHANVMSRCNLTILMEPGHEDLAQWYADQKVDLVCSLPCYTSENVDAQRGKGVFGKSIAALQLLNERGYGIEPDLSLDLVYNPSGAFLPGPQPELEAQYKARLLEDFGIRFNHLYTITNLPISRFRHYLEQNDQYESYMNLLSDSFNSQTIEGLMCRHNLNVDWLGKIYDCDFNQMLDIEAGWKKGRYLWDLDFSELADQQIAVGSHCFGCTAGAGSSCGGAIV